VDFDDLSGEAADVAYIFKVGREDHDRKRAGHLIFAEIDEVHAPGAGFHPQHFADDAFGFADVLAGVANGKAIGGGCGCGKQER
jgi:hypothetical protein